MCKLAGLTFRAAPFATPAIFLANIAAGLTAPAGAYSTKLLIDELTKGRAADASRAVVFAVAAAALGGVALLIGYIAGYLTWRVQQSVICLAEERLFARINSDDGLRQLEDPAFHETMLLAEGAIESAPTDVIAFFLTSFRQIAANVVFVGILFRLWPPMAAILVVAGIPALAAQLLLSRQAVAAAAAVQRVQRRRYYYRELLLDPCAAKEARLFDLTALLHGRMIGALREATRIQRRQNGRSTAKELASAALNAGVAAIGAVVVARAVIDGRVTVGDAVLFLAAVAAMQGAFGAMIPQFGYAATSLHLFRRYLTVVETPLVASQGESDAPFLNTTIEFRDVWFRYDKASPWALRGVTFSVPAGATVGIVGVNGAGKSTLVKLLLRLYEPDRGIIAWNGTDISCLRTADLRRRVGVVFQDFMTYDLPANENVGFGDHARLDDLLHIRRAAASAQVDDTIMRLSQQYSTLLSRTYTDDRSSVGTQLSGGQWQRIAIARALMRTNADLLILDEPSAGLDPEVEFEILQALVARQRCTKIIISHRLNAIRLADLILVFKDGCVIEHGNHDELFKLGGEYARLFSLQAAGYQFAPNEAV